MICFYAYVTIYSITHTHTHTHTHTLVAKGDGIVRIDSLKGKVCPLGTMKMLRKQLVAIGVTHYDFTKGH